MDLWWDAIRTAWQTISGNRLRSALTALTFALGSGAVVLMLSLASSAVDTIFSGFDAAGGREIVFLFPKKPDKAVARSGELRLTPGDAQALSERIPGDWDVSYLFRVPGPVAQVGSKKMELDIGAGHAYQKLLLMHRTIGRDLSAPRPGHLPKREIVLSEPVAKRLFGAPGAAVGKHLTLWGHPFTVVGVSTDLKKMGFNMGGIDKKRVAFVTPEVLMKREGMEQRGFIVLRDLKGTDHGYPLSVGQAILRHRHGGIVDFEFFDMQKKIKGIDNVFMGLKVVIGLIAALSLIIAGAGVMNVLLASVRQRVGEIGIRRALGASSSDVRRQFLVESTLIAMLGGAVGVAGGLGLAVVLGWVASKAVPGWTSSLSWDGALVGVGASALVGVLFGMRPASKAAQLEVVTCLRGGG